MVILLQINKITFGKSENREKNHISQKLVKILTEFFLKKNFFMAFLKMPWRK